MPKQVKFKRIRESDKKTLIAVVVVAFLSALLSFIFIILQLYKFDRQVFGRVVSVGAERIVIEDKKGKHTTLLLDQNAQLMLQDLDVATTQSDLYIHSFGKRINTDTFYTEDIRVMRTDQH